MQAWVSREELFYPLEVKDYHQCANARIMAERVFQQTEAPDDPAFIRGAPNSLKTVEWDWGVWEGRPVVVSFFSVHTGSIDPYWIQDFRQMSPRLIAKEEPSKLAFLDVTIHPLGRQNMALGEPPPRLTRQNILLQWTLLFSKHSTFFSFDYGAFTRAGGVSLYPTNFRIGYTSPLKLNGVHPLDDSVFRWIYDHAGNFDLQTICLAALADRLSVEEFLQLPVLPEWAKVFALCCSQRDPS